MISFVLISLTINVQSADFGLSVIRNKYKKSNDEPEIDFSGAAPNDQTAGMSGVIHKGGTRVYWPPELITSLVREGVRTRLI